MEMCVFLALMIYFTASNAAPSLDLSIIKTPEQCKNKEYCSIKPEGYDRLQDDIKALLPTFLKTEYRQRDNSDSVYSNITLVDGDCPTVVKTESVYQFLYSNDEKQFDLIVQTPHFVQQIKTVQCMKEKINVKHREEKRECYRHILQDKSLESHCVTTYGSRGLYVYNGSAILWKKFLFPVCCSCLMRRP